MPESNRPPSGPRGAGSRAPREPHPALPPAPLRDGRRPPLLARLLGRGRSLADVLLIKTRGCCLCDEALDLLQARASRLGLAIRVADVSDEPELLAVYGDCVPVVYLDGRLLFTGRVDPVLLRRAVTAH